MSRTQIAVVCAMAGLLVAGSVRRADAQIPRSVSVIVKISVDPSIAGSAIGATSGTVGGQAVTINELSWKDTHSEKSPLFEAGAGFRAGSAADILAMFNIGRAGGNSTTIGDVNGTPLTAAFDEYKFWGLEGGVRLHPSTGVGPYATITGGFRHIDQLQAAISGAGSIATVSGYDASTVPTVAFGGGMLWGTNAFAMGIEVAARYAGAPTVSAGQPIQPASGAGSRWSLPIGVVVKF